LVFCFSVFLVFLDIGVSYAVVLVICVSFSFSWSIVPFQVATIPAIPLFMEEPGIMMLIYDIPILISCPATFFLSFLLS
jgi:hypothetical protein